MLRRATIRLVKYQAEAPSDEERQAPAQPLLRRQPKTVGGTGVQVIDMLGMAEAAIDFEAVRVELTLRPANLD